MQNRACPEGPPPHAWLPCVQIMCERWCWPLSSMASEAAPSQCGSKAGGRKRRLSDRKAEDDFNRLKAEQKNKDSQAWEAEIVAAIRADFDLMCLVRSVIQKHVAKAQKESKLRRGVKDLGSIPDY
eukprot:8466757-Lingulodinium_polyedra.AAC.1